MKWLRRLWLLATSRPRAERLLLEFLTPQQRDDYRSLGVFIVRSQLAHNYLIGPGTLIRRLGRNKRREWYFQGQLLLRTIGRLWLNARTGFACWLPPSGFHAMS